MNSHQPKVQIGLPAYNAADYLPATIESLLAQDFEDWGLRIVDDASGDKTFEVACSYDDPRITVSRNESNLGQIGNWNEVSTGLGAPYFKLMCADDTLEDGCLSSQVAALDEHPTACLAAGKRKVVDAGGAVLRRAHGLSGLSGLVGGEDAIRRCVASGANLLGEPPAVMVRTSALPPGNPWRSDFEYCPDLDLWLRLLANGDLFAGEDVVASFRVHGRSDSASGLARQQSADTVACLQSCAAEAGIGSVRGLIVLGRARSYARMRLRRFLYRLLALTRERERRSS